MRLVPGKANLYLTVGPLRPQDGLHEIQTLLVPYARVQDRLEVAPNPAGAGVTLQLTGRPIPGGDSPDTNLACRAVRAYCRAARLPLDWKVTLHKAIPVGAGMGGGSADAAAALLELEEQQPPKLRLGQDALLALAASLGADVPFFLHPVPSLATGAGERLTRLPEMPVPPLRLLYPGFPSPVAWAYAHWSRPRDATPPPWPPQPEGPWTQDALWNDLAFAVEEKYPALARAKQLLNHAGATATLLSGSGSAVLGIFPTHAQADAATLPLPPAWELL
ncbi:MAG: 4-(cytidine 5'-diphospho)-2-C-methyl-D-erythritol kinase [Oligosphaeraceae bacterium]